MKSKDEKKKKQRVQTMKNAIKKFHLVSKHANYLTWDEKQNAPIKQLPLIFQYLFFKILNEVQKQGFNKKLKLSMKFSMKCFQNTIFSAIN